MRNYKRLYVLLSLFLSVGSYAIGYPENNEDFGSRGDFLWKAGTQFGRTANLTNIGPYLVNLPEGPGSTGVGLPNNTAVYHDSIWDMSNLDEAPVMIHEFDQAGQPIHAHATIIRFTSAGPKLVARNSGDLSYDPSGSTALEQIDFSSNFNWPNEIFTYSQMTSPFVTRVYWSYGLNRNGVYAIQDPSRFMQQPSEGSYVYQDGPIYDLFGGETGVWTGVPYVYWNHLGVANVTGFTSFSGNLMVVASDQESTGMAIYDVSGVREGRMPRLLSVYQPKFPQPGGEASCDDNANNEGRICPIGIGGYWVEPYGTNKMVFAARANESFGRTHPALYVVDFEDPSNPYLSCQIYFDQDRLPNSDGPDRSDGDGSSDPMYVNFQDEFIYVDHFKVDLNACEQYYSQNTPITGNIFHEVVYKFEDIANQCDASQYFRPLGQVGVFGGYDWWVTSTVNEQGMCGFVTSDEPDTRPPSVTNRHRPVSGQVNYPIDGFIHLHIPETLRTETVENAVTITNTQTNEEISYRQILSHTGMISIFPSDYLAPFTEYRVNVSGIQDYMGNTMADYNFRFTTGSGDLLQGETPFPPLDYENPAPPGQITVISDDANNNQDTVVPTYAGQAYFPNQSAPIACQPETEAGDVWVVNPDNDSVSIIESTIDVSTMEKAHRLKNEIHLRYETPTSVTRTDNYYAVTYRDDDKIVFFSPQARPVFMLDTGYGTQPVSAVFADGYLYVALYGSGELLKINIDQREIVAKLSVGPKPKAMALYGDRLLVTRFISPSDYGEVYDVNINNNMSLSRVININKVEVGDDIDHGSGVPNYLSGIVFSADGNTAYVSATKANTDRGLREGSINPQALDSDNTVRPMMAILDLVNNRDANINPSSRANTIDFDNAADPSAVTYLADPAVRVTALQGNNAVVLQHSQRNARSTFNTQGAPQGMCATRRTLYVKNFTGRSVSAIDVAGYIYDGSLQQNAEHISTVQNEVLSIEEKRGLDLFYHSSIPEMGQEGYMTCASCHAGGGQDGRVWDITHLGEGLRNTLSLNGASGTRFGPLHWSGNFDEVQDFELQMEVLNGGEGLVPGQTFNGQSPLEMTTSGLSDDLDALAAYINGLGKDTVKHSPHRTRTGNLTSAAVRGRRLFNRSDLGGESCSSCHAGQAFRDGLFHDVGTITTASGQRLNGVLTAIRTPSLIELWDSAPYFHDGSAATLENVLSRGSHVRNLSDSEQDDLIEYLLSIDREAYIDDE